MVHQQTAPSNSNGYHQAYNSIPVARTMCAGKSGRSSNNIIESTGSGASENLPPGEPLEAESAAQPATKAMSPGLPIEPALEAVHEAAAQHVSSHEQLPVDASGGLSASLGATQVLLWMRTSQHPVCLY